VKGTLGKGLAPYAKFMEKICKTLLNHQYFAKILKLRKKCPKIKD